MDSGEPFEAPRSHRASTGTARLPVLLVLHQEHSSCGHVGRLLHARGHPLDVRRPRFGDPLPRTLAHHAGSIVFGGPMSANDSDEYLRQEFDLVELALREQSPYLGICLGAQMMAMCLGARVAPHASGHVEIGYHAVTPLPAATMGGAWPTRFYQWHRDGFDMPSGARGLVSAPGPVPNQAFSYGEAAIGLQFHPEITYAMAARWSGRNEHRFPDLTGASPREAQLADHVAHAPIVLSWLARFLDEWLTPGCADKMSHDKVVCNLATVTA